MGAPVVKVAVVLAALLLLAYAALVAAVALNQRKLQYFPTHDDAEGRGDAILKPWRTTAGGFLGYRREVSTVKRAVLFFHGNGGEAIHRRWVAEAAGPDATVAWMEYPGYGARPGAPTETAIFAAAEEAYDALAATKLPVTVVGESLGTGVASYLASRRPVARLALISPFSSVEDVARYAYPFLPVRWVLSDRYRSVDHLASVRVPLFVVHGEADDMIPASFGRRLHESYRGPDKTFVALPGVGHNDIAPALFRMPEARPFLDFTRNNR